MKPDPKQRRGQADVSDLNDDPIVVWQHRHYLKLVLFMALIFPALVCSLCWADWSGGLIYAGILRTFFLQQATFCVNSLAHWFGEQPFDNRHSPRAHFFTALVTFGEGYHNFHHEFPSDFRNAIEWYQYDLTKWAIWLCARAGLAYDLKRFRMNEIEKGRVQQLQKRLDHRAGRLQQEGDENGDHHLFADLPVMSWDEYQARVREQGEMLVVVAGFVHDVTSFIARHPGGEAMMRSSIGRDATALFNGGIYNHSKKARDILATLRVGVLRGGGEVEIWKRTSS
jgi:stearoyl-CoA desaturase (Delta-9 desaturase)